MGEDPDNDDYIGGAECGPCEATLFNGKTPEYVLITIEGIEACPLWPNPVPDGAFLLKQTDPEPCQYRWTDGVWDIGVDVRPGGGCQMEHIPTVLLFFDTIPNPACSDSWVNIFDDCADGGISINGTAKITWGPSIHG